MDDHARKDIAEATIPIPGNWGQPTHNRNDIELVNRAYIDRHLIQGNMDDNPSEK
ncbi:hypothetical protein WN982_40095 [Paraburkholderia sp. IMGN_8]|uniref:hypothetical protein n=1 Tax=Paraburkholderia sp. IMGN_8 TaxID=3136564 RepID=UPI003100F994